MNFAVLSLPIYLLVRSEFASSCTATYSVQGQVLQNHTINAETADKIGDCILRCMAYPGCTSSNFYRKNKRCELSDKTHASHPDDMRHEPYTIYMVNTFQTIPCKTHNDCGVYLICAPSLVCEGMSRSLSWFSRDLSPAMFVPETKQCSVLMSLILSQRIHLIPKKPPF